MAGYLANMLGDANNLGFFATPEALEAAYPVGAPGYFAVVGSTNTLWVWDETTEAWVDSGAPGADAYVYIAYASDDNGTDFSNVFNSALDYIAIKNTTVQIPSPVAADFAGLWKKYKGEHGKGIASVVKTGTVGLVDTYTITFTDLTTFDYDVTNGQDGTDGDDGTAFIWKGAYSAITTYQANDTVSYNGSSYICILESTGNLPTDTTYWALIAQKGLDGAGAGDMLASVYDPTSVGGDAFDMDNMVEGTNNKLVSSAEKTAWNDKLDDITGESIADLSDVDAIAGITDGKVLKWNTNKFVVADDDDTTYTATDFDIKDLTDSTNLRTTWSGKQDALGFTPENVANKSTTLDTDKASDTKYPSVKSVYDWATGLFQTLANKVTSFQVTPDDTHYPSEKLTYDQLALKADLTTPTDSLYRQAIINGNFDVWQRGTSFVDPAHNSYTADRIKSYLVVDGGTSPTLTHTRQIITNGGLDNSFYHYRVNTNGAGTSLGVNSNGGISQPIEYGTRFLCGASKKVTVSFWAKSDIANKKIGVWLQQNYGTGGSPTTSEVINGTFWTLTSNWTKYTYTFTTNTLSGKTFGTDNNDLLRVFFEYVYGSTTATRVGDTVAETFVGAGNIDIAQVQLNAGSVALPFQPKSYAEELRDCQRYCTVYETLGANEPICFGTGASTTNVNAFMQLPTQMRTSPTLTATGSDWVASDGSSVVDATGVTLAGGYTGNKNLLIQFSFASGITQFRPYSINGDGTVGRKLILSAEL